MRSISSLVIRPDISRAGGVNQNDRYRTTQSHDVGVSWLEVASRLSTCVHHGAGRHHRQEHCDTGSQDGRPTSNTNARGFPSAIKSGWSAAAEPHPVRNSLIGVLKLASHAASRCFFIQRVRGCVMVDCRFDAISIPYITHTPSRLQNEPASGTPQAVRVRSAVRPTVHLRLPW